MNGCVQLLLNSPRYLLVMKFLTKKFLLAFFYNVILKVNREFLKLAMSEPLVCTEQA